MKLSILVSLLNILNVASQGKVTRVVTVAPKSSYFEVVTVAPKSLPSFDLNNRTETNKETDLSNGAVIALDITSPLENDKLELEVGQQEYPVPIIANARVSVGEPDVHYIYILDTSDSTSDDDGACGTVLECMQSFFHKFHRQIEADKSAKLVSLIQFDSDATVEYELLPATATENLGDNITNDSITSDGGTCCGCALEKARELAMKAKDQVNATVVIFAGDGLCNGYDRDGLSNKIEDIAETGAVVHTIAVGEDINCTATTTYSGGIDQSFLSDISANGGKCFDIPDSNNLPNIIDDLTLTNLTAIEVRLDGNNYTDVDITDLSVDDLPQENGDLVTYNSILSLDVGDHEICVRVSGKDISGEGKVEDCRTVTIFVTPSEVPTVSPTETPSITPTTAPTGLPTEKPEQKGATTLKVASIAAIVVFSLFLIIFIFKIECRANNAINPASDENDGIHNDAVPNKKDTAPKGMKGIETTVPVQIV